MPKKIRQLRALLLKALLLKAGCRSEKATEVSGFSRGGARGAGGYAGGIFEGFAQIQPNPAKTPGPKCLALDGFQNPETSEGKRESYKMDAS